MTSSLQVQACMGVTSFLNPAAITERALARNLHIQNKTPEEDLRGAG